ncbi:MAG TPA: hypothetical protein DD491_08945 [Halieaceae bacterium]|nr:hypothetical protein [Halieaceae bacterium]
MDMKTNDTYGLFMEALDVVNTAISEHKDGQLMGGLLTAADKTIGGKHLGVAVYRDDPDTPFDYFTLRFTNERLELLARGKDEPEIAWKVSQDYLRDLVDNPRDYIDNPARLDLDWLRDRVGV